MRILLNGSMVPEEEAKIPVFDRSFLFGDGLFETMRLQGRRLIFWNEHWNRLEAAADRLKISLPFSRDGLARSIAILAESESCAEGVVRLTVSRGTGGTGYSRRSMTPGNWTVSIRSSVPWPHDIAWRIGLSSIRFPGAEAFADLKTTNRLACVMSRMEAEEKGLDECLQITRNGIVAEGSSSSIFWREGGGFGTPPLDLGILPGITRAKIIQYATESGIPIVEQEIKLDQLQARRGVLMALSTLGVVPVREIEGAPIEPEPLADRLQKTFWQRALGE